MLFTKWKLKLGFVRNHLTILTKFDVSFQVQWNEHNAVHITKMATRAIYGKKTP